MDLKNAMLDKRFDTIEEYIGWLLNQPRTPFGAGCICMTTIKEIDKTFIRIGDGKNSIIDLPVLGNN